MSLLAKRSRNLLARGVGSAPCLTDLRRGQSGVVASICQTCDADCARRLLDLGFAPGARVEYLRRTPLGDPTIFRVSDYDIALRTDLSRMVLLEDVG